MERIRVLVAGLPALMREIIADAVVPNADLIQAEGQDPDLVRALDESNADVLLVSANTLALPNSWERVLAAHPDVVLIALASRGKRALVCEVVEEVGGEWLVQAIKSRTKSG